MYVLHAYLKYNIYIYIWTLNYTVGWTIHGPPAKSFLFPLLEGSVQARPWTYHTTCIPHHATCKILQGCKAPVSHDIKLHSFGSTPLGHKDQPRRSTQHMKQFRSMDCSAVVFDYSMCYCFVGGYTKKKHSVGWLLMMIISRWLGGTITYGYIPLIFKDVNNHPWCWAGFLPWTMCWSYPSSLCRWFSLVLCGMTELYRYCCSRGEPLVARLEDQLGFDHRDRKVNCWSEQNMSKFTAGEKTTRNKWAMIDDNNQSWVIGNNRLWNYMKLWWFMAVNHDQPSWALLPLEHIVSDTRQSHRSCH